MEVGMMNKLIAFPLFIMVALALVAVVYTSSLPQDDQAVSSYYTLEIHNGQLYVVDSSVTPNKLYPAVAYMDDDGKDAYVFMTDDGQEHYYDPDKQYSSSPFQMWSLNAIIAMVGFIIITVGMLGFEVFGSGFSGYTQSLTLQAGIYFGIWGVLSVASISMITADEFGVFGVMFYFALSFMYVIGFIQTMESGGD
jgi:hypothetical protein